MGILRKIISFLVLVCAVAVMVGLCMKFDWQIFSEVFKHFSFENLATAVNYFFAYTGNAIVLIMLGFLGLTIPSKQK